VVAVLSGVLTTLFQTASTAALPNVVPPGQLPAALGYLQSSLSTVRIFGAAMAGLVYALGRTVPFVMNAVSFAVSAVTLRFVRVELQERRTAAPAKLTAEIRQGLVWVWRHPVIRFLTFVQAADNLRYGAGYLLIILLARRVGASPLEIGFVFSGAAVGALLGALLSAW
jgi:Major Facilitator Superfamily